MKSIRAIFFFFYMGFGLLLTAPDTAQAADIAGQVVRVKNDASVKLGDLAFK